MNRRTLFLYILIFLPLLIFSQNQRFVYEYTFKPDSLNKGKTERELMNLDITKTGSYFYTDILLKQDSLIKSQIERGMVSKSVVIDMRKMKKSNVPFTISKDYPSFNVTFHTSINADNYALKDVKKINWTVHPETKNIEGFNSQKATTNFGGRKWTAWFTNEIQLHDGPYKFCSLPGLILNIEDEKAEHVFKFAGSQKLNELPIINNRRNEIFITEEKFKRLWSEYKNDPAKNIRQMHSNSALSDTVISDANGNPLSKRDLIMMKEERAKNSLQNNNNFIELDLYR